MSLVFSQILYNSFLVKMEATALNSISDPFPDGNVQGLPKGTTSDKKRVFCGCSFYFGRGTAE